MSFSPRERHEKLEEIHQGAQEENGTHIEVRELLAIFNSKRRGINIRYWIESTLRDFELKTVPADIREADIDGWIGIYLIKPQSRVSESATDEGTSPSSEEEPGSEDPVGAGNGVSAEREVTRDPSLRIGQLWAKERKPVSVNPNDPLSKAVHLMTQNDYSQLPVMHSDREVKGVISWESIARYLMTGKECQEVRECMEKSYCETPEGTPLLQAIDMVVRHEFALIRCQDKTIAAIVTAGDLGEAFAQWSKPFMLLEEIEHHIRAMIDGAFDEKELQQAKDPAEENREIDGVWSLTFGEYIRLIENKDNWAKIQSAVIDRSTFVQDLEAVRLIRNEVMHFSPDPLSSDDMDLLTKLVKLLQKHREVCVIETKGKPV